MKATALVALLALGAEGLALEDAISQPRRLPPVPQVFNPGPDGMPQLPDMEILLADYQGAKSNLNSQAKDFAAHLSQVERSSFDRIGKAKAAFDARLRAQEKVNQAVVKGNAHLAKEILVARQNNAELKKQVKQEEKLISFRRTETQALEQQLAKSEKFAHSALATNDPTPDVSFLHVAKATKPAEHAELPQPMLNSEAPAHILEASTESDEVSFLEVSRKHHIKRKAKVTKSALRSNRADDVQLPLLGDDDDNVLLNMTSALEGGKTNNAEDKIIDDLTNDLRQLHKAETLSASQLAKLFHTSFEAGKKRHVALLKQQAMLQTELEHTNAMTGKLQQTLEHLKAKLQRLEADLQKEAHFFVDLGKVALASAQDVPALLKAVSQELPSK